MTDETPNDPRRSEPESAPGGDADAAQASTMRGSLDVSDDVESTVWDPEDGGPTVDLRTADFADERLRDRLERAMRAAGCNRYHVERAHPFHSRRVATIRPRA